MKKLGIIIVLLLIAGGLFAQDYGNFGIGANVGFNMWNEDNISSTDDGSSTLMVQINLSLMLGENFELRPFLGGGFNKYTEDGDQTDGGLYLGGGVGTYFHLLKTDFFRMGPGVSLDGVYTSDTYPSSDTSWGMFVNLKIPMMMEFVMTKNFVFRMEYTMLLLSVMNTEDNSNNTDTYINFKLFPVDPSRISSNIDYYYGTQIVKFGFDFRF